MLSFLCIFYSENVSKQQTLPLCVPTPTPFPSFSVTFHSFFNRPATGLSILLTFLFLPFQPFASTLKGFTKFSHFCIQFDARIVQLSLSLSLSLPLQSAVDESIRMKMWRLIRLLFYNIKISCMNE